MHGRAQTYHGAVAQVKKGNTSSYISIETKGLNALLNVEHQTFHFLRIYLPIYDENAFINVKENTK